MTAHPDTLPADTSETIARAATHTPATDHLNGDPAPTRRQTAAVLRALADFTHNEHMVDVAVSDRGEVRPDFLARHLTTLAERVTDDPPAPGARVTVNGDYAQRITRYLASPSANIDLREDPTPTPRQVAAILNAVAQSASAFMTPEVNELGADRSENGPRWQRAVGIGRYFHVLADHLTDWDAPTP